MNVAIFAGGTGGHILPALTIAEAMIKQGDIVQWIGSNQPTEQRISQKTTIPYHGIFIRGVRKSGWFRLVSSPFFLLYAFFQSVSVLRKMKADLVICMGGFVSVPGGLSAKLLNIPMVVHEQNAVSGLANRLLAPMANIVLSGYKKSDGLKSYIFVGNPVREQIQKAYNLDEKQKLTHDQLHVLVVGGSQGANFLNTALPATLKKNKISNIEVWHQCGYRKDDVTAKSYSGATFHYKITEFIDDMNKAYSWADVIICRAGAMTVAEICAVGLVGFFVPYPQAVNDHQAKNLADLLEKKAGYLIRECDFDQTEWLECLQKFANNRQPLMEMAQRASSLSTPMATESIINYCRELTCKQQ